MGRKPKDAKTGKTGGNGNGTANLGFEQKLWQAADKLRGTMVKRIQRKYDYPSDKQERATATVLQQAELLCGDWAENDVP